MTEVIFKFFKLKNEAKKRFGRDFTTILELMEGDNVDKIKSALTKLVEMCEVIEDGQSFKN